MSLTPIGIIRRGSQAAQRRRYGYAALRVLRACIRRALAEHARRSGAPQPYGISVYQIRAAYFTAMRKLRARWPDYNPNDPRAEP